MGTKLGEKVDEQIKNYKKLTSMANYYCKVINNNNKIENSVIVDIVIQAIKNLKPLSQDLLFIACELDKNMVFKVIENVCNIYMIKNNNESKLFWCWYENYLQDSLIWYNGLEMYADEEKMDLNKSTLTLFDKICNITEKCQSSLSDILAINIKTNKTDWHSLLNNNLHNYQTNNDYNPIRQDSLLDYHRRNELYKLENQLKTIDSNNKKSETNSFNGKQFYNNNIYLSQQLLKAYQINDEFQKEIQKIFNKTHVQAAPIKKQERCQIKSETDYSGFISLCF